MNAVHQYDLHQDDEAHFKDLWCPMRYMVRCPGAEFLQNIVFTNVGNAQMKSHCSPLIMESRNI